MDEFGEGGREDGGGEGLLAGPEIRAQLAHGDGDAVAMAVGVGHEVGEVGRLGRVVAVPDVI